MSDDIFFTQSSFSGTTQWSCELKSLFDVPADLFDGLDVGETVTELFEEQMRSGSTKKVAETSKKVEVCATWYSNRGRG